MDKERIGGELLKGHITTMILAILDDRPRHGYEIMKTLSDRTGGVFELGQGTVYPLLYSLEEQGWICSAIEVVEGRRRRVYSLTALGRKHGQECKVRWRVFQEAMNRILEPTCLKGICDGRV